MKVAVIGVGAMGRNHARVYSELPEVDLVAVSDADVIRAESTAEKFGVRAYTDYRELLEKEKPDAVSIVVPTAMHEEVGKVQCPQAGKRQIPESKLEGRHDAVRL